MARVFISEKYPFLTFYVNKVKYKFYGGRFDVDEYPEVAENLYDHLLKTSSSVRDPNGIYAEEDYGNRFRCGYCSKRFASQQGLNGHKPAHKDQAQINKEAAAEGATLTVKAE